MALRQEDLYGTQGAVVLTFPTRSVRARVARQKMLARRRRSAGALLATIAVAGLIASSGPSAPARASAPGAPRAVTVAPGQTLWDLARRYGAPGADTRVWVDAVIDANGLAGAPAAGQRLVLP